MQMRRQYLFSESLASMLQITSISSREINDNELTSVIGFQDNFSNRSSFLLKANILPELVESAIAYVYTCNVNEFTYHSGFTKFEGALARNQTSAVPQISFAQINKQLLMLSLTFLNNLIYESPHIEVLLLFLGSKIFLNPSD